MPELEFFQAQRPRLFSIAYRMLGNATEAEDVLQDAWLRFHSAESGEVRRIRGGVTRARAAGSRDDLDDLRRQLTEAARRLHPGQLPAARRLLLQALTACERHERRTSSASLRRSTGT